MKYDILDLFFFKTVFQKIDVKELLGFIEGSASGRYVRRIGYLYEFLIQSELPINIDIAGNYIDLLDDPEYVTGAILKNKRWKINDNLLGTPDFCPIVKRTNTLNELLQLDVLGGIEKLKEAYSPEVFRRATNYACR